MTSVMVAWVVLLYGILVAVGGLMGYTRAGSLASLISGGLAGLVLVGAAITMLRGSYSTGWWVALIVALLLLARFGINALSKGWKLMPGGLVVIASLVVLAALLARRAG